MEINPRIFAYVFLFGIVFAGMYFLPSVLFPNKAPVKISNISNNTTPNYIYVTKTVLVTPTPDGHIYFASEYQNGTRLLQRPFSFFRDNATGYKDMKVTTIIYDYRFFDQMHFYAPEKAKYIEQTPTDYNKKYLLIFVYTFMDDIIGEDTRMWLFNRNMFAVQINNEVYRSIEYPYQVRFKELEETYNFNHDSGIEAYKQKRIYTHEVNAAQTAGEKSDEQFYLRGGRSNAIDGFLIFEVPKETTPEDVLVLVNFYSFGTAQWRLRI